MLDIGFMEIFVIGALALIVVGPKDLPGLLRTVGQFVGKARGMAREFQRTMEDAAREADLGDVADVVKGKGNLNKLPFDNQIVDSMKEFERSVKAGVDGAKTEFDNPKEAAAKVDPASPSVAVSGEADARPDPSAPVSKKVDGAKKVATEKTSTTGAVAKAKSAADAKAMAHTKTKPEKSA